MLRSTPRARIAAAVLVLLLSACRDQSDPLAPTPKPGTPGAPAEPTNLVALDCKGDREAKRVDCTLAQPTAGGANADLIVGNQNTYVTLASTNEAYNSGTGQFTFDVTVKNLIPQPLGTTDGSTLSPNGVRVFFFTGPAATSGTGTVAVVPDGFATFTGAGQPFYQYNQVLATGATSSARTWTLVMPPTVTTFAFQVYVSAPVQFPDGFVKIAPTVTSLRPGTPQALTATVVTAVGNPVPGALVTWGTSDAARATVDGSGGVKPISGGAVTITATSGTRTGNLAATVTGIGRTWNGSVSTAWTDPANWDAPGVGFPSAAPVPTDSALVPGGAPRYPLLAANTFIGGVSVANGGLVSLAGFDLTVADDAATAGTGSITATTGHLVLTGTGCTVAGTVPGLTVTGTYSLSANTTTSAPVLVRGGLLRSAGFLLKQVP
ncbi:MAG TPA: Ig-like domain-containing protein [Longimicrobiaceae bacterium]|jgi:hypothetical protein|nr:Ig-like domain-containing protein [Longimicrobiaceae bacterium]